ncbi:quinone oxidoreductase family protein [Amycolatopsis kentuckyensis]|uniref:quinone oxidoreductase family protein n=1 Tax=Amycolatopsis kentuckyensis TaxID=218823 RepID=UPI0035631D23
MQAIVVDRLGGPDVLTAREVPDPEPGPGELLVDITVAGVNFMDTGARQRGPAGGSVPFVPGVEAAGVVRALGPGVTGFAAGDRVAWVYAYGSYAGTIAVPAASAVPVPPGISDEVAAGVLMQGITAHHFTTEAYPVRAGDVVLVHAAAGGLGRLITQIAKHRGAEVIGVVSREEKVIAAKEAGADHVLISAGEAFVGEVLRLTGGEGVHAVFDGNGEPTFRASLRALRRNGTLLYYGAFIGDVPTIGMQELPRSIKICYPTFRDHIATREELLSNSADLFALIASGKLTVAVGGRYPLAQAAQAHRDLESRRTTGKLLLLTGHFASTKD